MASTSNETPRPVLPNETPGASLNDPSPLSDIVVESTQRLAEAEQAGVKIKRGRGRPRKDGTVSQGAPGTTSSSQSNAFPGAPIIHFSLAPVLEQGIKIPFAMHAATTKFDGWLLTDPEAKLLATQLDEVLKMYMPAMDPRTASLSMLAASLMMVAGGRFVAQKEWEKKQEKAKPVSTAGNTNANGVAKPAPQAPPPQHPAPVEQTSGKSIEEALGALH